MKSLTVVFSGILHDMGDVCGVSTERDLKTVLSRVKEEGDSFLTITLPTFAKSLEKALDRGFIAPTDFAGFKRRGGLPCFCRGFLELIFDSSGVLLPQPSVDAIRCVRQIALLFSKILRDCGERRTRRALRGYVEVENELRQLQLPPLDNLKKVWLLLFGDMMGHLSDQIDRGLLIPKHGPGATADRLTGNRKWKQKEWPVRLNRSFPLEDYLIPSYRYHDRLHHVKLVEPRNEVPVRVTPVPKTLKTPRIIAIEPTSMQYAQQALLDGISRFIQSNSLLDSMVGLSDQQPSRDLACLGSKDGSLATLDLQEASDRVSNRLVFELTRPYRAFNQALQDCRSKRADVPGIGVIPILKFASMGSAVCFPIEAMVFSAICCLSIIEQRGHRISRVSVEDAAKVVRVFGDDIIVPRDFAEGVSDDLSLYGLKVNRDKSFWTGRFRESCGGDFYDGVDVSIHRFRQEIPRTPHDARGVAALFSFRNKCYVSGYWKTARLVDSHLESLRIPLPRVSTTSSVLGRLSVLGPECQRIDKDLHTPLVKGMKIVSRPPASPLGETDALLKFFSLRRTEPLREGHLEHLGRPKSVRTRLGWGHS